MTRAKKSMQMQRWGEKREGVEVNQTYHTWHKSENEAYKFAAKYIKKLGKDVLPANCFFSVGLPKPMPNRLNKPLGEFVCATKGCRGTCRRSHLSRPESSHSPLAAF